MREPAGLWDRWETLEAVFAAAALLLPAYLPWPRVAYAVACAVALAGAAAVTWSKSFADGLGVDEAKRWPFSGRAVAATVLWVIAAAAAYAASGLPSIRGVYAGRQSGAALMWGAIALLLFGHLVGSAAWRWTLARRARRLGPEAERQVRRLLSQHERGLLTSDELRAAWKELSAQRRA